MNESFPNSSESSDNPFMKGISGLDDVPPASFGGKGVGSEGDEMPIEESVEAQEGYGSNETQDGVVGVDQAFRGIGAEDASDDGDSGERLDVDSEALTKLYIMQAEAVASGNEEEARILEHQIADLTSGYVSEQ